MTIELAIAICLSCMAGIVQRTTGFGFGIFLIPLLMLVGVVGEYSQTISLSTMLAATLSLITAIRLRQFIRWKHVIPMLMVFIPTSFLAGELMIGMHSDVVEKVLGLSLILLSIYFIFFQDKLSLKPTRGVSMVLGVVSGVMGGMFSMQGPPIVLYYLATQRTKEEYMAQCQLFFCLGNIFMTLHRTVRGVITTDVLSLYAVMLIGTLIGLFIGEKVFDKLDGAMLKRVIFVYLAISGLIIMVR